MTRPAFTPRRLAAAVAVALALPLAACGSSSDDASSDQAWTYTDDLGTTLELDKAPERIVAQSSVAAALTDLGLGDKIVGVFGPLKNPDGDADLQAVGLDVDDVVDITGKGEYGDLDLEKLAELRPDVVLTSTYVEPTLWYVNEATQKKLEGTYPIGVISYEGKTQEQIFDSAEKLAVALGADREDFAEGRRAFAQASTRLKAADAALGHPTYEAVSLTPELFYVSNPDANPDLQYYRDELGLDIVTPKKPDLDEGGYWQSLSWEKADLYDADYALWDARGGSATLEKLRSEPVWGKTTAARNDAYVPWNSVGPPSPQGRAAIMDLFSEELEKKSS